MIRSKDLPYYAITVFIFIGLKFSFTTAGNSDLTFLTYPCSKVVSLVTRSAGVFSKEVGFLHQEIGIAIDKSCSGFNFFMLCFIVFQFRLIGQFKGHVIKIVGMPFVLVLSYLLTIFANTSRILSSTWLNQVLPNQYHWLHEAEGAFIYLFLFVSFYIVSNYLTDKLKLKYAKLA